MRINYASIDFNQHQTPVSKEFDDVYFSNDDGFAETDYVFMQGNNLYERWQQWTDSSFCIAETGFGTGANIVFAIRQFETFRRENPEHPLRKLRVLSFEKFPIAPDQLAQIAAQRKGYEDIYQDIIHRYPQPIEGFHHIDLSNFNCDLTLVLGDVNDKMPEVYARGQGEVDAWFLDGFAPSKNEQMWQDGLFRQMARISKDNCSFATFTAAGIVKRGLASAGFEVRKTKGYGKKRDMLVGSLPPLKDILQANNALDENESVSPAFHSTTIQHRQQRPYNKTQTPWLSRQPASVDNDSQRHVVIIGGGIAGFITARELLTKGFRVTLLCKDEVASGASGNLIGGFYPQLQADASVASRFYVNAFNAAYEWYKELSADVNFEHEFCGVLQLGFNDNTRQRIAKMQDKALWPESLATFVDAKQASDIAGVSIPHGGLFIPKGGWISPLSLVKGLQEWCCQHSDFTLHEHSEVTNIESLLNKVQLSVVQKKSSNKLDTDENGSNINASSLSFDIAVVCSGDGIKQQIPDIDFRLTRGQVEHVASHNTYGALKAVICHKGYFTPSVNGIHALGSTYAKNDTSLEYRSDDRQTNLNTHQAAMIGNSENDDSNSDDLCNRESWSEAFDWLNEQAHDGRAAMRSSTPDHLPVMGNLPNFTEQASQFANLAKNNRVSEYSQAANVENVFVLAGLGSRGLTTAPLMATLLSAQIQHQWLGLENSLLNAINPNRFLIRDLFRKAN